MARVKRPNFRNTKNIRANVRIDPQSLAEFNTDLRRLGQATRVDVTKEALEAGGMVIHDAAEQKAPGPHIEIKVMRGSELAKRWRSSGAQGIKADGWYVAIGPDKAHWYYRFAEYGTKTHGVRRRSTRRMQGLRKQGMKASAARKQQIGKRTVGSTKPAMVFTINGKLIFARKVRGVAAKPFLRPAADTQGNAAVQAMGKVLKREIERAARG